MLPAAVALSKSPKRTLVRRRLMRSSPPNFCLTVERRYNVCSAMSPCMRRRMSLSQCVNLRWRSDVMGQKQPNEAIVCEFRFHLKATKPLRRTK